MKGEPTPGPWEVYGSGLKRFPGIDSALSNGDHYSVVVFGNEDESDQGVQGRTKEEAQANARLIAAAPELLRLLKDAVRFLPLDDDTVRGFVDDARAAIAKAEGRL